MRSAAGTATGAMADLVVSLDRNHLSDELVDLVARAFVDCLGCGLAGSEQPEAAISGGWVETMGGASESSLVGRGGTKVPAANAALANAVVAHALDYDDFALMRMMHPSVVLVPVVLALGERERASGLDAVLAYVAGYEVTARVCAQLNPDHYARGWHSTSTVGVLGAAAAAARMLRLDADGVATAVAIAASSAGGLRENFGTMVKPLHAGNAAYHGVAAAELAARGFTAGPSILDGPRGFPAVYRNLAEPSLAAEDFSLDRLELASGGITFKRYTCCGAIHSAIDALLELREEHGLRPEDVARMRCGVHPRSPEILIHHVAATPEQGRFSVEYSLAVALTDGDAGVAQYTEERLADPTVQELSRRVEVYVDEALGADEPAESAISNTVVAVETTGGATFERRVKPHRPLTWDELERKFRSCASVALDAGAAEQAFSLAAGLAELDDVGALARAFAGAAAERVSA
jgi:2-methylcitrate dehydratase PrpD